MCVCMHACVCGVCVLYCFVLYCILLHFACIVHVSVISWAAVCVPRLGVLCAVAENVPETKFSYALKKLWTAGVSI